MRVERVGDGLWVPVLLFYAPIVPWLPRRAEDTLRSLESCLGVWESLGALPALLYTAVEL